MPDEPFNFESLDVGDQPRRPAIPRHLPPRPTPPRQPVPLPMRPSRGSFSAPKILMMVATVLWLPGAFIVGLLGAFGNRPIIVQEIYGGYLVRTENGGMDVIPKSKLTEMMMSGFVGGFTFATLGYFAVMFILLVFWFTTRPE